MRTSRAKMHTAFHVMEAQGFFDSNPANAGAMNPEDGSPLYNGPIEYPKMLYHPTGAERQVEPQRIEPSPTGNIIIPARKEMITKIVNNPVEEDKYRAEGWHDHPADAIAAGGGVAPLKSSDQRIKQLEAELARLQKQITPTARPLQEAVDSLDESDYR